jgi:AraC-like DNA-binding protein
MKTHRLIQGHEWRTHIRIRTPLAALPCPLVVCEECRNTPAYHWDGAHRRSETFGLLQCTLAGEGRIRRRGEEHRLPPGTAFLCAADDPEIVYFYPREERRIWRFAFMVFRGGGFREIAAALADRFGPVLRLGHESPALLAMLALRAYGSRGIDLNPGEGARLVYDLLATMTAESAAAADADQCSNLLVERGLKKMEEGLTGGAVPVSGIARSLGVSREHFTRVFTRQVGQSPKTWLARRQMNLAARLVKDGGPTVKEIAERLGYPSAEAFTKAFTRHFAMPPFRFRREGMPPLA